MGLIFKNKISFSATIGIWEMDESENNFSLSENEMKEMSLAKNESRKKEIRSVKFLIKELRGKNEEISYDENGKPYLKNSEKKISISHSGKYIAAIIETKHETGIDIQKITLKILRIQKKFLSEKELEFINENENKIEVSFIFWGAKECVFKAYGERKIIFSENIFVKPFNYKNSGEIVAHLNLPNEEKIFQLCYEKRDDFMLVYITDLINIVK